MKQSVFKVFCVLLLSSLSWLGYADVPGTISFQGQLLDADGNPVEGTTNITFSIPGTTWTETHTGVQIQAGMFGVLLGSQTSLDAVDFSQISQLRFSADGVSQVVNLSSVPTAIIAQKVVEDSDTLKTLACTNGQVPKSTGGNWGCAADEEGSGGITGITAGAGLTGGGTSGNISLAVTNSSITGTMLQNNAVNSSKIADRSISSNDVNFSYAGSTSPGGAASNLSCSNCVSASEISGGQVVKSLNGIKDNVKITNGSGISITNSGNQITVTATGNQNQGGITGITAGAGLTGGGTSGNISLAVTNNSITGAMLQNNAVNSSKIVDGSISSNDVNFPYARSTTKNGSASHALNASNASNLSCNACVSASEIVSGQVVKSINNLKDSVSIQGGTGINVSRSGSTITVSAEGSSGGNYVDLSSQQTIGGNKTFSNRTVFNDEIQVEGSDLRIYSSSNKIKFYSSSSDFEFNPNDNIYLREKLVFGSGSSNDVTFEHRSDDLEIDMGSSKNGELTVNGELYVLQGVNSTVKRFKIDHPLDPDNKYLIHASVESPDMMNVYGDNIVTDDNGEAVIRLPDYFEALNKDFRYQLTCIGTFAQAIIAEEVQNNQFKIKTDKPHVKVSWQVTGIRQDAWANAHRIIPEIDKPLEEKGTRLFTPDK